MAVEMFTHEKWGETRRETGMGIISDYVQGQTPTGPNRNAQVTIKAEHLQEPVTGWIDTVGDRDVHVTALRCFQSGQRIFFRIEVRRKDEKNPVPWAELGKRDKTREALEITAIDGQGLPVAAGVTLDQTSSPAEATPPPADVPRETPRPGARVAEARPWEPANSDGSLNLGSYAVTATESMVLLAHDLLVERWKAGELGNEDKKPPTEGQLRGLARRLLLAADRTQAAIREDGHADRLDNSHTRARAAVRAALQIHPVPFREKPEPWVDALVATATEFMTVVVSLVDREVA